MKKFSAVLLVGLLALSLRAADLPPVVPPPGAPTPDAPKTAADAPKADAPKTEVAKDNGELPKAPEGKSVLSKDGEVLTGTLSMGAAGKGDKKAKKKSADKTLVLYVKPEGKKDKGAEKRTVKLTATGDILTQLNGLAEKHAHVRVTGNLNGDAMTVTTVTEEAAKEKKKKSTT
jgi:hypothetical protein